MAATALGIFNHLSASGLEQGNAAPLKGTTNNTTGSGGTTASGADAATISANDFLTLLVTEMKNQDPTANTDPNEYINQLVQVNSLEQLISINQTLTADSQGPPARAETAITGTAMHNSSFPAGLVPHPGATTGSVEASVAQVPGGIARNPAQFAVGNLTIPAPLPAPQRIAHSLGGIRPAF